jgi:brefeldin A-inhibited guanine nucleotide-exchange protein
VTSIALRLTFNTAAVQVAVLRAMLTIVSSTTIQVHYVVLLLIVRACYNIFIMSRSETTQQTAKAVLTQIANIVFERLLAGEAVHVKPVVMPDLSGAAPGGRDNRREVLTAQSVVMSVWQSIADPAAAGGGGASKANGDAAFLPRASADGKQCARATLCYLLADVIVS